MAEDVQGGVIAAIEEVPNFTSLAPSGVWANAAPSELPLPFVVVKTSSQGSKYTSEAPTVEEVRVSIECYAVASKTAGEPDPAQAIALAIQKVFDGQSFALAVDGLSFMGAIRTGGPVLRLDPKRSSEDERVFVSRLDYLIRMQGTRAA